MVDVGDTIFIIRGDNARLNSENALEILKLSRENSKSQSDKLKEFELQKDQAWQKYQLDSSVFYRQKKLWEQEIGSKIDLEQKELAFQVSKKSYSAAVSRLSQLETQLSNETRRAEIGYEISKVNHEDFIIKSRIKGMIYDLISRENELITPQTPMAVIGSHDQFYLEMQVDEYDIARVQPGQKVFVSMDSYKGEVFEAIVTAIDPIMNERTRTFLVEAEFKQLDTRLFPNLTAECNIIMTEKQNAMTIPRKYLYEGKYVYNSSGEKVEVQTGLIDYDNVEIISGLDSSTEIYMAPKK